MVHSVAGLIAKGALTRARPYRAPHHSASMAALTGGGLKAKPGEVSLAHNGVLFLDELPEFGVQALDSLRGPLETGEVMVARANAHVRYPARVQLVAAMNPCRCGHGGAGRGACGKAPRCIRDYQGRVSGPLMDRIDLAVDMPAVTAADLSLPPPSEGTAEVAARVARARGCSWSGPRRWRTRPIGRRGAERPRRGALSGEDRRSRRGRAQPADPRRRGRPDQRPRLDPRPAPGPHHRRPGGRGQRPAGARVAEALAHRPGSPPNSWPPSATSSAPR
jgi:hypothetical protein